MFKEVFPKPVKPKPQLYARYFEALQEIARTLGYNLVLHGSLSRDMDLIAIPWVDDPADRIELIHAFSKYLTGEVELESERQYHHSKLPGGRDAYVINLNRGNHLAYYSDPEYYIDISVTPFI